MLPCQRRSELFCCIQTNKTDRIPSDFPKERLNNGANGGFKSAFIVGERRGRPLASQSNSFDWNQRHNNRTAAFPPSFRIPSFTRPAALPRNAGMLPGWRRPLGRAGSKGQTCSEIQWAPLPRRIYIYVCHEREMRLNPDIYVPPRMRQSSE